MELPTSPDSPSRERLQEVFWSFGHLVYVLQRTEVGLKQLLPYIHPQGHALMEEGKWDQLSGLFDGMTLGQLRKPLEASLHGTDHAEAHNTQKDRDAFSAWFSEVVQARNELIHTFFFASPERLLTTTHDCEVCLVELERRYQAAKGWDELVQGLLRMVVEIQEGRSEEPPE